jgi:ring-1,2-phenylacetyl-CoA epoxidase subunit PaaD
MVRMSTGQNSVRPERSRGALAPSHHTHPSTSLGTSEEVWAVLERVPDPEIPVLSVVDLGIVREVAADRVAITPTYTGCPATQVIERDIRAALDAAGFEHVRIDTVLSPPWTTEWISEAGKAKLRAYGIAPPTTQQVECPQCGSTDTEELSRFGSTPCKAQWRCRACLEPFDLFKCH